MQMEGSSLEEADDEEVVRAYDYKVHRTYLWSVCLNFNWSFVSFHVLCI